MVFVFYKACFIRDWFYILWCVLALCIFKVSRRLSFFGWSVWSGWERDRVRFVVFSELIDVGNVILLSGIYIFVLIIPV